MNSDASINIPEICGYFCQKISDKSFYYLLKKGK